MRKNLARFGNRVEIIPAAVRPEGKPAPALAPPLNPYDTCQFSMLFRDGGTPVPTITLDDVLARSGARVRLLKLDCEGAEYAILESAQLDNVDEVCGEAHHMLGKTTSRTIEDLALALLSTRKVKYCQNGPYTHLWWARLMK